MKSRRLVIVSGVTLVGVGAGLWLGLHFGARGTDRLTEEEAGQLREEWVDPSGRTGMVFVGVFQPRILQRREKERYARRGRAPFQFAASLKAFQMDGGGALTDVGGIVHLWVQDADGRDVLRRSLSLKDVCPS